jgi:hypothetical protein
MIDLTTAKARLKEYLKDLTLEELTTRLFRQSPRVDGITK